MPATQTELLTEFRSKLDRLDEHEAAIKQIEGDQLKLIKSFEQRVRAIRATSFDDRGNYRGVFQTEDDARTFGLCVLAFAGNDQRAREALSGEMRTTYQRALGGITEAGEGLIPIEFSARVQRLVETTGVFARSAFPMPMHSDSLTFQRRTSGFTVFKTGKNVAASASDMGFQSINLNADEGNVLTLYPKAMAEDAAAEIGELVAIEIATAFSAQLDRCGLVGDGTPVDLDVVDITTRLQQINGVDDGGGLVLGSGNLWSELAEDDFNAMVGRAAQFAGMNPAWVCSAPFFFNVMNPIALSKGGVTRGEFAGRQSLQFLGFPVELTPVMPKTEANSQIPCLFGDLRMSSTHGRRRDLVIEESHHVKFIERQVAVLGTQRHAIANHTLGDDENAGPVVGLITAAG